MADKRGRQDGSIFQESLAGSRTQGLKVQTIGVQKKIQDIEKEIAFSASPDAGDDLDRTILSPCDKLIHVSLAFYFFHALLLFTEK